MRILIGFQLSLILFLSGTPGCAETSGPFLKVAAVQFLPKPTVSENADLIVSWLEKAASEEVDVVAFQECALTGYNVERIEQTSEEDLLAGEKKIAEACQRLGLHAVLGTPQYREGKLYNTAVVFDPDGKEIERYSKIQLVGGDRWAQPGNELSVFKIENIPCSIIICHDERYPELVRLPVLAGARLVFYISCESDVTAEHKLDPYRAQIQARAVENGVFVVHSNSPAMESHGQSRIIRPDGNLIAEATMFGEEMIAATLDLSKASAGNAQNSYRSDLLREWWEEGVKKVRIR
jgi:predicted amidohydrolase